MIRVAVVFHIFMLLNVDKYYKNTPFKDLVIKAKILNNTVLLIYLSVLVLFDRHGNNHVVVKTNKK